MKVQNLVFNNESPPVKSNTGKKVDALFLEVTQNVWAVPKFLKVADY